MVAVSLPTEQRLLHPRLLCTVDDVPSDVLSVTTMHGVNQLIGTATIEVPLPLPAHFGATFALNRKLEIQAGFDETTVAPIFSGRLIDRTAKVDSSGRFATFRANGWAALLNFGDPKDLIFPGPIRVDTMFRALCQRRGVPLSLVDNVMWPDGTTPVRLGGNPDIDEGNVIIPRDVPALTWFDTIVRPFGYRIFDCPNGILRLMRISGKPPAPAAVGYYSEGVNAYRFERSDDLSQMVTYWEVKGARWTDGNGVQNAIRSIPASVPANTLLVPPGYRKKSVSHDFLISYPMADAVRNVYELDNSAPYELETWDIHGDPMRQPGDLVWLTSPTLGLPAGAKRWLMSLRQTVDAGGYLVTMQGWAGAGTILPAGNDCTSITVRTAPVHLGDENLSHYAVPSPSGKTFEIAFSVPDYYSSITLYGKGHGSNSYLLDDDKSDDHGNYESTVSKFEIWQGGDKPVGSGTLPALPENLNQRLNYTNLANWSDIVVPISGQLKPGQATLKIISGEDRKISEGFRFDDFEVRDLVLRTCGANEPTLPWEGL